MRIVTAPYPVPTCISLPSPRDQGTLMEKVAIIIRCNDYVIKWLLAIRPELFLKAIYAVTP